MLTIDLSTVYRHVALYQSKGVDGFLENRHKGYWGLLDSRQLPALRKELREHIHTDAKSVAEWIKSTFGVEYTPQGVVDLLNRIGFTYKKTSEVPCEADASRQEAFAEELSDLLSKMPDDAVVYYADGVHPTHNTRSTYAWIEKGERLEQPAVSGRDRVNINGLLNAHDVTNVIARDCESVNAESTKEVYQAALERHPEASVIYIISDNTRYYHNKKLKEWVDGTKIKQIFLPPYSPNLKRLRMEQTAQILHGGECRFPDSYSLDTQFLQNPHEGRRVQRIRAQKDQPDQELRIPLHCSTDQMGKDCQAAGVERDLCKTQQERNLVDCRKISSFKV